jgi:hypothetical protein
VGLAGMRELNGSLEINSNGSGTSLRTTVPLFVTDQSGPRRDHEAVASSGASFSSANLAS